MEQQRLAAYLSLIQTLLTCPQGEEWIYLKQQEDLVDAQFVMVMEQVANQLVREGDPQAATFLHNWAAKLHHILLKEISPASAAEDKSEAYLDFIEQLLACPQGTEDRVIMANQALLEPGLVQKMQQVAKELRQQGDSETAYYLEEIAHQLNQAWLRTHNFQADLKKTPHQVPSSVPEPVSVPVSERASETASASVQSSSPSEKEQLPHRPVTDELEDPWDVPSSSGERQSGERQSDEGVPAANAGVRGETPTVVGKRSVETAEPVSESEMTDAIAQGLQAIAQALGQLSQTLNQTLSQDLLKAASVEPPRYPLSSSPLEHLEALERACQARWQLTTEEVEQLIGVKPKCHGHDKVFARGNWRFVKVGHLGSQLAWQVTKVAAPITTASEEIDSPLPSEPDGAGTKISAAKTKTASRADKMPSQRAEKYSKSDKPRGVVHSS